MKTKHRVDFNASLEMSEDQPSFFDQWLSMCTDRQFCELEYQRMKAAFTAGIKRAAYITQDIEFEEYMKVGDPRISEPNHRITNAILREVK